MAKTFGTRRPAGSFSAPAGSGAPASWSAGAGGNRSAGTLTLPPGVGGPAMGGAGLTASVLDVPADVSGVVSQLRTTLTGAISYSKVSGAANVSIAAGGAISLTSGLSIGATNSFVARAVNASGDAVEKQFVLTGTGAVVTPPVTPTPTISGTLAAATVGQPYDQSFTVSPAGTPVSVNGSTAGQPHSVGNGIIHNGYGRFTSTGVTA